MQLDIYRSIIIAGQLVGTFSLDVDKLGGAKLYQFILPGNPPPVEPSRPAGFQLAAEGRAAVLGDDRSLLGTQGVGSHAGGPRVQCGGDILPRVSRVNYICRWVSATNRVRLTIGVPGQPVRQPFPGLPYAFDVLEAGVGQLGEGSSHCGQGGFVVGVSVHRGEAATRPSSARDDQPLRRGPGPGVSR